MGALVTLPLVLPPAVIGFYLLVLFGPQGTMGQLTQALGLGVLPFTFAGLVVASVLYSMPFVVQPIQQAFVAMGDAPLEAAMTLRASPWDAFFSVALPLAGPGFVTAAATKLVLGELAEALLLQGAFVKPTRVLAQGFQFRFPTADKALADLL